MKYGITLRMRTQHGAASRRTTQRAMETNVIMKQDYGQNNSDFCGSPTKQMIEAQIIESSNNNINVNCTRWMHRNTDEIL